MQEKERLEALIFDLHTVLVRGKFTDGTKVNQKALNNLLTDMIKGFLEITDNENKQSQQGEGCREGVCEPSQG